MKVKMKKKNNNLNTMSKKPPKQTSLAFGDMDVSVHTNISQDVIVISEDRLKLKLIGYEQCKKKLDNWVSPLAIFITSIVTLITTDFKKALLLSGEVWNAIFVILTIVTFVWFLISLSHIIGNKKITIDFIIDEIKKEKQTQS